MRRFAVGLSIFFVWANLATVSQAQPAESATDLAFDGAVAAVREKNYAAAVSTFKALAEQSHYDAQYNLALLLERGLGMPEDFKEAFKWGLLAKIGKIKRANRLVNELQEKLSEETRLAVYQEVQAFLRHRVDTGDRAAIMEYAFFQANILPEPDHNEAYVWYSIAAALNVPRGIAMREQARELVLPEELETLQARAKELFTQLPNPNGSEDTAAPTADNEPLQLTPSSPQAPSETENDA